MVEDPHFASLAPLQPHADVSSKLLAASSLTPAIVAAIIVLGIAFLLVAYYRVLAGCFKTWVLRIPPATETSRVSEDLLQSNSDNIFPTHTHNGGIDDAIIKEIPIIKYSRSDGSYGGKHLLSDKDCAVCLGDFGDGDELRLLPNCRHAFHVACIDEWLRSHSDCCPICRCKVEIVMEQQQQQQQQETVVEFVQQQSQQQQEHSAIEEDPTTMNEAAAFECDRKKEESEVKLPLRKRLQFLRRSLSPSSSSSSSSSPVIDCHKSTGSELEEGDEVSAAPAIVIEVSVDSEPDVLSSETAVESSPMKRSKSAFARFSLLKSTRRSPSSCSSTSSSSSSDSSVHPPV